MSNFYKWLLVVSYLIFVWGLASYKAGKNIEEISKQASKRQLIFVILTLPLFFPIFVVTAPFEYLYHLGAKK